MYKKSLVFAACCLLLIGCKKKDQPAQDAQGFQQGQSGPGPVGGPGGPNAGPTASAAPSGSQAPAGGQVPPLGAIFSDPSTLQNILSGALAGGAATIGGVSGAEIILAGIKMKADTDAKGMKADGQLLTANLQQDGHAQGQLTLEANRCYSVVGFAGFGVFRYQINVITAPPAPPQVLAQSSADGPAPTVGPNEQCIRNPYPTPMVVTVDMHVLQGQGSVGAQAYKK